MKTIFDHIEYIKGKPHHIRKKIVFATAGCLTAVVALIWFAGTLSSGTFAIQGSNFAESTGAESSVVTGGASNTGIAGAGAALESDKNAPAHIEIIDSSPATSTKKKAEPTVIPF